MPTHTNSPRQPADSEPHSDGHKTLAAGNLSTPTHAITVRDLDVMPVPGGPALKDMTVPQLEAAHAQLDTLEAQAESLSGACATLRGLVLAEIKERLPHGQFQPWVKAHYKKSYRSAANYMQLGAAYVAETKSAAPCTFGFLLQNAAETLEQIELARLDLRNPLVADVVKWSRNKSATQLLLDIGPAPRGGNTYDHSVKGKGITGPTALPPAEQALNTLGEAADAFFTAWPQHWPHIPHHLLKQWDSHLLDMRRQIKKALGRAEGAE